MTAPAHPSSVDALRLRRVMGRDQWGVPEPFGPDGWRMSDPGGRSVIVTCAPWEDGVDWVHASVSGPVLPSYDDLVRLRSAVWGEHGWAYQVFAPPARHVNIHATALHLWGRLDGAPVLPDFGAAGTI